MHTSMAFFAVIILLGIFLVVMTNSLVQLRVRSESAFYLHRLGARAAQAPPRFDSKSCRNCKGSVATNEKTTFEDIANSSAPWPMQATGPVDKAAAENQLSGALKSLFAVAENYPQLQASQEFTQLQNSLSEIEDAIQNARRYYNRRGARFQHQDSIVPDQHPGWHVRLPAEAVLRSRRRRSRAGGGEVLQACRRSDRATAARQAFPALRCATLCPPW